MTVYHDWRELPFHEIWLVDTEFYPGAGYANGGRDGDPITPLCLVAIELRTGRPVRLWQDQLGLFPPYRLDPDALIVFFTAAELGVHQAKGWGEPTCMLDAYIEFRHYTNDGSVEPGDREKGFYGLSGALRYFGDDGLDLAHKKATRDRILQGPPFTAQECRDFLTYCEDDTRGLARLFAHIVPTIRSLPHAMLRAKYQWPMAGAERRGIPVNLPLLTKLRNRWPDMQTSLVRDMDRPFGIYEIVKGRPHWRTKRFETFVRLNRMSSWPRLPSGALDTENETFREMEGLYPFIGPLRELRYSLSKLKLNDLSVGNDGRARCPLWAYGTKTGRNAPSTSQYPFGPAKWIRHLITAPLGRVLIHRDYSQQEVRIAAVLSGDRALLEACESGDVYLGIARQLGFISDSMSAAELENVRALFKIVVLSIQYGGGAQSLANRTGVSLYEAREILARLHARFRVFVEYSQRVLDYAGLNLEVGTQCGWYMQCPPGINPRTVRNFPMQSTGSEILHAACIMAERRGIPIIAPVHDAIMVEGPAEDADALSTALDRVMRDASAVVLRGYELPTDEQRVLPGQHFRDKRGAEMWTTVTRLLAELDQDQAAS